MTINLIWLRINLHSERFKSFLNEVDWGNLTLLQYKQATLHFVESQHVIKYFNGSVTGLLRVLNYFQTLDISSHLQMITQQFKA